MAKVQNQMLNSVKVVSFVNHVLMNGFTWTRNVTNVATSCGVPCTVCRSKTFQTDELCYKCHNAHRWEKYQQSTELFIVALEYIVLHRIR